VPLDMPITLVDEVLRAAVHSVKPFKAVQMTADTPVLGAALVIRLRSVNADNETSLRNYRNRLSATTGIRFPNHDTYNFHISLAYDLVKLNDDEQTLFRATSEKVKERLQSLGAFKIENPKFVMFDDMGAFFSEPCRR
jgi:hypothetical protein